jgi:hypothetical protein
VTWSGARQHSRSPTRLWPYFAQIVLLLQRRVKPQAKKSGFPSAEASSRRNSTPPSGRKNQHVTIGGRSPYRGGTYGVSGSNTPGAVDYGQGHELRPPAGPTQASPFHRLSGGRSLAKQMLMLLFTTTHLPGVVMSSIRTLPVRSAPCFITLSLLAKLSFALAQDPPGVLPAEPPQKHEISGSSAGWHHFSSPRSNLPGDRSNPNDPSEPSRSPSQGRQANRSAGPLKWAVPLQLTLEPGTFVTVRVNQFLSSDRTKGGDAFSASLVQPLVVDGVVVARRGQTVGGRVAEAHKAGRVKGVSRLRLQLTDLTLVDGRQVPVQSPLLGRTGPKSLGRDASAIAGTTAFGAAVGAAAGAGAGAAIGAGAGAVAATVGVLLTRGRPTVIYPESVLTFQIEAPVTISTNRAPQAFRYVNPNDYGRPYDIQRPPPHPRVCGPYGCAPPPRFYGNYRAAYYP